MASDYVREEQAPDFKSGPTQQPRQRTPEPGSKERSIFSSFRPSTVSREPAITNVAPQGTDNDLHRAVRRYARSALDIAKMQELKLPVLPHQVQRRSAPKRRSMRSSPMPRRILPTPRRAILH